MGCLGIQFARSRMVSGKPEIKIVVVLVVGKLRSILFCDRAHASGLPMYLIHLGRNRIGTSTKSKPSWL